MFCRMADCKKNEVGSILLAEPKSYVICLHPLGVMQRAAQHHPDEQCPTSGEAPGRWKGVAGRITLD